MTASISSLLGGDYVAFPVTAIKDDAESFLFTIKTINHIYDTMQRVFVFLINY